MIKYIVWDWNGTLLDDIDVSIEALNYILQQEMLAPVKDKEEYKKYFQFPVIEYYKKIGFDFNKTPFTTLAKNYMSYYQPKSLHCNLHEGVEGVLFRLQKKGLSQYLLSASNLDFLHEQLAQYKIQHYFEQVLGLDNVYANSKVKLAQHFMKEGNFNPNEVVFIGDSVHDSEVASTVRSHCILIANGHEHKNKLIQTGNIVVNSIKECEDVLYTL